MQSKRSTNCEKYKFQIRNLIIFNSIICMSKRFEICLLLTVISNYPVKVSLKLASMNPEIQNSLNLSTNFTDGI